MESGEPERGQADPAAKQGVVPVGGPFEAVRVERRAGRRRRMFTKADGKFPDPPHPISILLGLLGPAVAVVAVYVASDALNANRESLKTAQSALQVSETNMKVGQRAYVVARNGAAELTVDPEYRDSVVDLRAPIGRDASLRYKFELHNLGRTPASVTGYEIEFRMVPSGWQKVSEPFDYVLKGPGPSRIPYIQGIAPGEWRETFGTFVFDLTAAAMQAVREANAKGQVTSLLMRVTAEYDDVFDDRHDAWWCWSVAQKRPVADYTAEDLCLGVFGLPVARR